MALLQALLKAVKELLTAVVNVVSLVLPQSAFHKIVYAVREVINKLDEGLEWIKEKFLGGQ